MIDTGAYGFQNFRRPPFNAVTSIQYRLLKKSQVTIKVFNSLGQEIRVLLNDEKNPGYFTAHWAGIDSFGRDVTSGVYLYCIHAGSFVSTKKMILIR